MTGRLPTDIVAAMPRRTVCYRACLVGLPLLAAAAILAVFTPLTPAYDVNVFLRAGGSVLHGHALYPALGSSSVYSGSAYVYPYFAALPFALLSGLPASVAGHLFFFVSATAVAAAAAFHSTRGASRSALVLCTSFTITGLQLGALSPLLFAGALMMWHWRERLPMFVLAAPLIAAKLFLAPLFIWLLLARRRRALTLSAAASGLLLGLGFLLGPIGPAEYARMLTQLSAHEARSGMGLIGALMNRGVSLAAAQVVMAAVGLAVVIAAHARYRRTHDERVLFCAAVIVSLILTPVLWSHYLVLLAACLLVFDVHLKWLASFTLASWVLAPPHGLPHSHTIELAALPGLLALLVWVSLQRVRSRRSASIRGAQRERDPAGANPRHIDPPLGAISGARRAAHGREAAGAPAQAQILLSE
ncbi:MAG: hypothetical protein JWL67_2483 [Solirubrobacterales bacterium]|nr:hypothetical protein [Solirubrobacterales bacterium]